ncbi:MAG: hypothetical protein JST39_02635 [Bacteroidetes bacterium]|nr:hypothetical protein [Bacteroidota bacterium]
MHYPEHSFANIPHHLTSTELKDPRLVIADFFSTYHLPDAIRELERWVRSAFAQKSRLGKNGSLSLLNLQELLIRLLEATLVLDDEPSPEEKVFDLKEAPDTTLLNTALFYIPHNNVRAWDCFPRHLSRVEYGNPYLVFARCHRRLTLAGWNKFLKDLFYAATYDTQINEAVNNDDLYYTCKCLFKLLEACHLIHVRELHPDAHTDEHDEARQFIADDINKMTIGVTQK